MTLLDTERAKYDLAWQVPAYRIKAHGLALWESRRGIFPPVVTRAVDLGCGHGRLFARWRDEGIDGWGVDFSDHALDADHPYRAHFIRACLWELSLPQRFDLGVCADVMEHIPEVMVPQTLNRIAAHVDTAVFKIANSPSRWLGVDLHPTLRPADWWMEQLASFWSVERLPLKTGREEYLFRCVPN